jgi:hypothetical protein
MSTGEERPRSTTERPSSAVLAATFCKILCAVDHAENPYEPLDPRQVSNRRLCTCEHTESDAFRRPSAFLNRQLRTNLAELDCLTAPTVARQEQQISRLDRIGIVRDGRVRLGQAISSGS